MQRRRIPSSSCTFPIVVAVTVAAVLLAGCTNHEPGDASAPNAAVAAGDAPSHPTPVPVSDVCAEALAPARTVVATVAFAADMSVEQAAVLLSAGEDAASACTAEELDAVNTRELGVWRSAVPPTMASDEIVDVDPGCAEALRPLRDSLAAGERDQSTLYGLVEGASERCTAPERLVVTLREVEPHLRRAGVLPLSTRQPAGADPGAVANQENTP